MTWQNFSIYINTDQITIHFPSDPQPDKVGGKLLEMLTSKGFVRTSDRFFVYKRSRTDFWEEQCRKLAAKFNAIVTEQSLEQEVDVIPPHLPSDPDPIAQHPDRVVAAMQAQIAAMQTELVRLREEVEELKK